MSPALAQHPSPSFPQPSKSELESLQEDPRKHAEHIKSWQFLVREDRLGSCFASGLPTPPDTRTMTGISVNQHHSNDVVSQSYYPSTFSYPGYPPASSAEVRNRQHNADSYNHNKSSSVGQSQYWSSNRDRADRQAPKDTSISDSTIASYLQIPSSINDTKGSLAEFVAEVGHISCMLPALLTFSR